MLSFPHRLAAFFNSRWAGSYGAPALLVRKGAGPLQPLQSASCLILQMSPLRKGGIPS